VCKPINRTEGKGEGCREREIPKGMISRGAPVGEEKTRKSTKGGGWGKKGVKGGQGGGVGMRLGKISRPPETGGAGA